MAASRYKNASQIAKTIGGMRYPTIHDPDTGLAFMDGAVVTTGIHPVDIRDSTRGAFVYANDVRIIDDLLKPFEPDLDYKLREKRSADNAFLKKIITDRGERPV